MVASEDERVLAFPKRAQLRLVLLWICLRVTGCGLAQILTSHWGRGEEWVIPGCERDDGCEVPSSRVSADKEALLWVYLFFAILVYCLRGPSPMVDNRYSAMIYRFGTGIG